MTSSLVGAFWLVAGSEGLPLRWSFGVHTESLYPGFAPGAVIRASFGGCPADRPGRRERGSGG